MFSSIKFGRVLILMAVLFVSNPSVGQEEESVSFITAKAGYTNWFDPFVYDIPANALMTEIDMTTTVYEKFSVGASFLFTDSEQKFIDYAVSLGYDRIGFTVEKAVLQGRLKTDRYSGLIATIDDYGDATGVEGNYSSFFLYRYSEKGRVKHGLSYTEFNIPSQTTIYFTSGGSRQSYLFADPYFKSNLYGLSIVGDNFLSGITNGKLFPWDNHGLYLSLDLTLGLWQMHPSNFRQEQIETELSAFEGSSVSVSNDPVNTFGGLTRIELGYAFTKKWASEKGTTGYAIGFEHNTMGAVSELYTEGDDFHERIPRDAGYLYYGFFLRVGAAW